MEVASRVAAVHSQFLELAHELQELVRSKVNLGASLKGLVAQLRACWQKEEASSGSRLHHQL